MRQAINEGFILDVLKNYTTYKTYWRIEKAINYDLAHDKSRAKVAIARFVSLDDGNHTRCRLQEQSRHSEDRHYEASALRPQGRQVQLQRRLILRDNLDQGHVI